ncbi:MAG TPA: hypothetical protein PK887_08415 [Ignavibacteriales bacterium]|nr:hypothetical protein [Ignavibacteriales bacterium]
MELQREIIEEKNKSKLGKKVKIIYDGKIDNERLGRTEWQAPEVDPLTVIETDKRIIKGKFYDAEIVGVQDYDIVARII